MAKVILVEGGSLTVVSGDTVSVAPTQKNHTVIGCTQGVPGTSFIEGLEAVAGEDIAANLPIKLDLEGKAFIVSNLQIGDIGLVVGFSKNSAIAGGHLSITTDGEMGNATWTWAEGVIYLGDGIPTQTIPTSGFSQVLASSNTPTKMIVNLMQAVIL